MYPNLNQEINANYKANDIFKPINASQLTRAIHYDYVITQEMFDAYIEKSTSIDIDVGNLIVSNLDGSTGEGPIEGKKAPCSIYIAANTGDYELSFHERLHATSDIVDWSEYLDEGNPTLEKTHDVVNVYSSYPYRLHALCGGINHWSTFSAPVIMGTNIFATFGGICKIGYYTLESTLDLTKRYEFQVVLSNSMNGNYPVQNPEVAQLSSYRGAVVFANWMGGAGVTTEYSINVSDTSKLGLFQSMSETYNTYKNEVSLRVYDSSTSTIYYCSSRSATSITFSNFYTGKTITISQNGSITWSMASSSGGSSKVTLVDLHMPEDGRTSATMEYGIYESRIGQGTRLLDSWDSVGRFNFGTNTILDWYTWSSCLRNGEGENISNENTILNIDFESLSEGIVYEINLYLIGLSYFKGGVFNLKAEREDDVVTDVSLDKDSIPSYTICFMNSTNYAQDIYGWGVGNSKLTANSIGVSLVRHVSDSSAPNYAHAEYARGRVLFTKINNAIHVLAY